MTTTSTKSITNVGMGSIAVLGPEDVGHTVLGSCIGLVLFCDTKRMASLAHIVLPTAGKPTDHHGKFADTAIPEMLKRLGAEGIRTSQLIAKFAGGASMFTGIADSIEIGKANAEAVEAGLKSLRIRVVAKETGGQKGRKVVFNPETGRMRIEKPGEEPIEI